MDDFVKMVEATLKDDRDRFFNFLSLVKQIREAQKVYSEMFPTGYECYAPTDLESEVDELLKEMEV